MEGNYNVKNFESIFDYDTKIADFNGPLDLLLHLVKKAQIDIKDIFISEVTEQFMSYLDDLDTLDIEIAGEYLGVAATLLYEKSKALLPKIDELLPEEDTGSTIIRRLQELQLFKDMSVKLKELENVDRYYKNPEPTANDYRIVYKDFNFDGLIKAFSDLLSRVELERKIHQKKEIPKEIFTVPEKMQFIRERMLEVKECSFFELFKSTASKSEIITTFQAMLELLKRQVIKVEQKQVFDDITVLLNEEIGGEDIGDFGDLSEYN
ncbi:MAG: segregation/condensation protein A [Clostridia bacterium]|nr:segregation/condensation protein A [Clostridia bacterium]